MKNLRWIFTTASLLLSACASHPPSSGGNDDELSHAAFVDPGGLPATSTRSSRAAERASRDPKASPRSASATRAQLVSAKQSGSEEEMRAASAAALATNPNDAVALNALAMQYYRQGHPGIASLILQRAFKGNERSAGLQNNLGLIYLSDGNLQSAILSFKEALAIDSRLPSAAANLGWIYVKYGDYEHALPLLETAFHYNENDLAIATNLAVCLAIKGDLRRAKQLYNRVLSKDPRHVVALYDYAILLIDYDNNLRDGGALLARLRGSNLSPEMVEKVAALQKKVLGSEKR